MSPPSSAQHFALFCSFLLTHLPLYLHVFEELRHASFKQGKCILVWLRHVRLAGEGLLSIRGGQTDLFVWVTAESCAQSGLTETSDLQTQSGQTLVENWRRKQTLVKTKQNKRGVLVRDSLLVLFLNIRGERNLFSFNFFFTEKLS